ncbi:hypothetical protein [Butyrivibrio sp. YAB3001]|uniref:hypothetical protein n=1 Tax=Butyrivibrio sp. YAB3001 TaxID=1520812 RepID=UPI0008F6553B|nr:hypothetical protein [Butyrivibrio sp. YAB3001]SFC94448.1 hypothetical protein SAMN02910398_03582 [Butyrivibrio sp. YAB3001]
MVDDALVVEMIGRYKREFSLYRMQYLTMGRLLDEQYIRFFLEKYPREMVYVIGDNYLGMQMIHVLKDKHKDVCVVNYGGGERWGENTDVLSGIEQISMDAFFDSYCEGVVIICILNEGERLRKHISERVPIDKIYFANELILGR